MALLSSVGKTFCMILNDRVETMLEKEEKVTKRQAGFRPADADAGLTTHCVPLDVQKPHDTGWRDGLLEKGCKKVAWEEEYGEC